MGTVYGIAPGTPFIDTVAEHLLATTVKDTLSIAQTWVILPTQRGCSSLKRALVQRQNLVVLPRLMALADLDAGDSLTPEFPPVINGLEQQGLFIQLIRKSPLGKQMQSLTMLKALACDLINLLTEAEIAEIDLAKIHTLDTHHLSQYWQQTADLLKIITEHWPQILASLGKITAIQRQRLVFDHWCQRWQETPPPFPIILAGTTGTRPMTARLVKAIRQLPGGELILPGFDALSLARPLPLTHPLQAVQQLLTYLGEDLADVQILGKQTHCAFMRALMQPAEGIPQWDVPAGPEVTPLVCSTQALEAKTIAVIAREAQQDQKTICIITSDLMLTRQIESELRRWNISPVISYGTPLHQTPVGIFSLLTAELLQTAKVTTLLALLKHPFCCFHEERSQHLAFVYAWEKKLREKAIARVDLSALPRAATIADQWLEKLQDCFRSLRAVAYPANLNVILRNHHDLMRRLSGEAMRRDAATDALSALWQMITESAESFPPLTAQEYVSLLQTLLAEKTIPSTAESSVMILGRLEARLFQSDIVIIAGCNEGSWPPRSLPSPWLTANQRQQLGLPPLESFVGRAAYDFCMALSATRVFITRALSVDGAPTIPSRWLERLQALLSFKSVSLAPQPWREWAKSLDMPKASVPLVSPKPCPPAQARPLKISVSGVQRLMRDPYVYYASAVLRLRPLPALERPLAANDWGILVHKAIHDFTEGNISYAAANAAATLYAMGAQAIESLNPQPATRHFLRQRWDKMSSWLVEQWRCNPFVACWSEIEMQKALGDFQLTAIADRLELVQFGALRVIDFKTGMVPSYRDVKQGLAPQLPLEGVLSMDGAFTAISSPSAISLMYWQLSGYGDTIGEISDLKEPMVLIEEAAVGAEKLLNHFANPTVPYAAVPEAAFPDYEPLIRRQEWYATKSISV